MKILEKRVKKSKNYYVVDQDDRKEEIKDTYKSALENIRTQNRINSDRVRLGNRSQVKTQVPKKKNIDKALVNNTLLPIIDRLTTEQKTKVSPYRINRDFASELRKSKEEVVNSQLRKI